MPQEHSFLKAPRPSCTTSRIVELAKLQLILFYLFLAVTALALFLPLNPRMPSKGLDASWEFALNETVARHMSFGKEIVYTYGPYGSMVYRIYHPATDRRMMLGNLLVGLSYIAALLYLARGRKRRLLVVLLLFLATFRNAEVLFMSYAFLLVLCVIMQTNSDDHGKAVTLNWRQILTAVVMWSTLGLLLLTKGSLLLPVVASAFISSLLLLYRARIWQAISSLLIPAGAAAVFWVAAGQSLADLPAYLRGILTLTSGYTEAMATSWAPLPAMIGNGLAITSIAVSALVLFSIIRSTQLTVVSKSMLAILFAVFQLVSFKHGFVGVANMPSVFASLAVSILLVGLLYLDKHLMWSLSIAMVLAAATSVRGDAVLMREAHEKFGVGFNWQGEERRDVLAFCMDRAMGAYARTTYQNTWDTYSGAWQGLHSRVSHRDSLESQFAGAKASIRSSYTIPSLSGTVDIYGNEQSVLLASNNRWNPRPMFQSVTAFTPALARINEQHLRGASAPDWVLFKLDSIDARLPSLDDGMSWPALFDNYTFISYDGQFVLMRKKQNIRADSDYEVVYKKTCKTGATVTIPEADGPLFAEVELKPTLAGKALTAIYRPPQLHIVLGLKSGSHKSYRVVSNMMVTGFFVSPLVNDTADFASLAGRNKLLQDDGKVESISIAPSYGGSTFWSDTYVLTLKRYVLE